MKAFGVGRFAADPVSKQVGNTSVCEFRLAVQEYRKINGERKTFTSFFDFVVWDAAAELISLYKKKGDLLLFYATPRQDTWVDKTTGNKRSKVIFRIDEFQFLARHNRKEEEEEVVDAEENEPAF